MIVQRKKEKFNDSVAVNGVGFTGSLIVKNSQQLKLLEEVRIVSVLEDVSESAVENENDLIVSWI